MTSRRAAPTQVAFWFIFYVFAIGMLGTTLPTPLYVLYETSWHFSNGLTTVIYASYAAGVIFALLFAGRSSDEVGRRKTLGVALTFSATSTIVFILASGIGLLFAGRVLSGLSAGLITGTATATLTDLAGPSGARRASLASTVANMGGLGLGPLVAGLFSQYAPGPTVLVFVVYLGFLAIAAAFLLVSPETVVRRERFAFRFEGVGVPADGRSGFLAASLAAFCAFALLGLFSALAPSFLAATLHQHNRAVAGAVVFLIFAVATATQVVLSKSTGRSVMLGGLAVFPAALGLIVAGLSEASFALFLVGTALGGIAAGSLFLASLSTANRLAPDDSRSRVVSAYFLMAYVGLTIPVIAVGVASQHVGAFRATLWCSVGLTVLCLFSARVIWSSPRRTADPAAASAS